MKEIVVAYQNLKGNLSALIDNSGYKIEYIAKRIGMIPNHFYVKKRRGNWNDEDVMKILDVIDNEETENYFLSEIMKDRLKEDRGSMEELMSVLNAD
ncbi:MAG: hypothetical protein QM610_07065 [Chitinophagaceae bacterium]